MAVYIITTKGHFPFERVVTEYEENKMIENTSTSSKKEQCKCCGGNGYQTRTTDGIKVVCPACQGTGIWNQPRFEITCKDDRPTYPF
jgi:DnaJ-class molecular chaperone